MNRAILSLGSNRDREMHIRQAVDALRIRYPFSQFACPIYTSSMDSPLSACYMNLVAVLRTEDSHEMVKETLKELEAVLGRRLGDKDKGIIPIDIDILQWNGQILKAAELSRRYVKDSLRTLEYMED